MAKKRQPTPLDQLPDPSAKPRENAELPSGSVPPHAPIDVPEVVLEEVEDSPGFTVSDECARQIRGLVIERARRKLEALRLYEALPAQETFHTSKAPERLLRGSNRGGKTLPAAVEVARAVTGQDPHGKYPKGDGRCKCVGKDGKHLGQVMYRKLFRAGAFKIIRDQATRQWRAFRPWEPADLAREHEAKPAPPLIPPRFVKAIAWENKKESQPSVITLHNGWELTFYSSLGKPPQGSDEDLAWFDEEIVDPEWYPESSARLLDRKGRFIWSATPQAGTEQLYAIHERAEEEQGKAKPRVTEHIILLDDNPHIDAEQKRLLAEKLSEQDYQVRIAGEFALLSFKIYPEFSAFTHCVEWFEIPRNWTLYAVIDPGRQVCAVLFAAVPPPEMGDRVYLFEELYLRNCDAEQFGQAMRHKTAGRLYQAFVIDAHGARIAEAGSGLTVQQQYAEALRRHGVSAVATGHNFVWGSDDVAGGVEAVRGWLRVQADGKPKLLVVGDRLPNFLWEIKHYRYKRVNRQVTDKPEDRGRVHQMANVRYLAMYRPRYVKPPVGKTPGSGAIKAFRDKQARKQDDKGSYVRLGPGKK